MYEAPSSPSEQAAQDADHASSQADDASETADGLATGRDDAAVDREVASDARDVAADARDRIAEEREFAEGPGGPEYAAAVLLATEVRELAAADRELAATDRRRATIDRQETEADRTRAAGDREHAAMDREHAAMDRQVALAELQRAHLDDLTGAYRRGAGEEALRQEMTRSMRSGESLVVAFVDVDGLKRTNDCSGHAAGDARLRDVVSAMRSKLRSYEPIVRYGGDEFVCSMAGVDLEAVRVRLAQISAVLSNCDQSGSISFGLAQMRPEDTLERLVDRADTALIEARNAARR